MHLEIAFQNKFERFCPCPHPAQWSISAYIICTLYLYPYFLRMNAAILVEVWQNRQIFKVLS